MTDVPGYTTQEKIYEGRKSIVYRALREQDNQPVIIKVYNNAYPTPEETTRFLQEYSLASKFQKNEGVIQVYGTDKANNTPVIVMEDFGGRSLYEITETDEQKLSLDEFLSLALFLTEGIGNIHKRNIIHKDINPSNIIWNPEKNIVKITDFGISTELPREITSVKNANILEGTLAYISPEQTGRMNRALDYRTDFYSLGVTFYRMLTGRLPFEAKDALGLVYAHIALVPVPPHQIDSTIPRAVSEIILKLMDKNAEDRYQSAHGLKLDLERCLQEFRETGAVVSFTLGLRDVSDKFQIPQELYGRKQETDSLLSAFERVSGGETELMLVSGSSGIGKSLLVNEIQKHIVKNRGYFTTGKFERLKKDMPYSGIIQAFAGLARQILAEDESKIAVWKKKILSVLGPNGKILTDINPLFELIIGKQPDVPALGPVQSQNRFNLVFQGFIKVLANKNHVLVVFLDDLQWADSASLHLLKLFTTDSDIKHLFIIGAYRHNETPDSQPFILTLDEIKKTGAIMSNISLQPLSSEHVNQLLSDTLNRSIEETKSLTDLLIRKTRGNPFFVNEFLKSLYKESLIEFSFEDGWSWHKTGIEETQATDNVADLISGKITDLSEKSQEILKLGACIGSYFNIATLLTICEEAEEDILPALNEILQEGMLDRIDDIYRFSHDRVLEAAYSLISDEEKIRQHYRIGNLEFKNTSKEELPEKIFYIVNQLNAGIGLVTEKSEKRNLAELNLMAGEKALSSNAYASALNYLKAGIGLLEENCWQEDYDFTLPLYQKATVAAQLGAEYEMMEKLAEEVLQNAGTILDKIKVYEAKIFACIARNQLLEVIRTGLQVLRQLGISMPEKPGKMRVLYELLSLKLFLIGKPVENLINLPEMKDPHKLAVMQISTGIAASTYYAAPELFPLLVFSMVRLSVKYGNSIYSPYTYAGFGMIHCGVLGDLNTGYEYGKLALNLVEKFSIRETKSRVWMIVWYLLIHWKRPLSDVKKPLLEAYKAGLETGDLEFAANSANTYSAILSCSGIELAKVEKEMTKYAKIIRKLNQDTFFNYHQIRHQAVLNLRGMSEDACKLSGSAYDDKKMLPVHKNENDKSAYFYIYYYYLNLNYLFENNQEALKYAELVKPYIGTLVSSPYVPLLYFYDSLVRLALYPTEKKSQQIKYLKEVAKNQKKIKKWAFHSPMNYSHKYYLVEAEIARVQGQELEAKKHYKLAIKLSRENKFLQYEALALKLVAKFKLGLNDDDVAGFYMEQALYTYNMWGASAIVKHIEEKYGYLFKAQKTTRRELWKTRTQKTTTATETSSGSPLGKLDMATVMKSAQTISGEIILSKLLEKMMKIVIENAGAQKGFLILEDRGELYIEAEGTADSKSITVLQSVPAEKSQNLSEKIVHYVARTKENVVLNDAVNEGDFTSDEYIMRNKPRSVLCAPIVNRGKLSGILYLENNLTTNAFTDERLELLRILSSQAAISIENARLLVHRENAVKLKTEMEIAANIQTGLLPKSPSIKDFEISAHMAPADEVGGDYYDIINTAAGDWVIIGDVSGHGVHSGLIMMMVQTSIHNTLSQNPNLLPAELLMIVNKTITENIEKLGKNKYMTITALVSHEDGKFTFAGLHQNIMLYRENTNSVEIVETNGMWIGIMDDINGMLNNNTLKLNIGDIMLVYTDGIIEAREKASIKNKKETEKEMFGEYRLQDILLKSGKDSLDEIKNGILKELEDFNCVDDVTLVLLKKIY